MPRTKYTRQSQMNTDNMKYNMGINYETAENMENMRQKIYPNNLTKYVHQSYRREMVQLIL